MPAEARPLVTLWLMAFRQEAQVRAAIEGAFAQTYEPLEIILSDDASPDGTYRVMEEMAAAYTGPHRVRLNRNPVNLGIIGHFNRLAGLARGELLVNAAGDDVSEPDRPARLAAPWAAARGRVFAVHSDLREIDAAGRPGPVRRPAACLIGVAPPGPTALTIAREMANCVGAAWDRAVFDRFGPLPETREGVEDGPLFLRAALLGGIAHVAAPLVRWRTDGLSGDTGLTPGHDYLRGNRIKFRQWVIANMRSWRRGLAAAEAMGLPCPDRAEIEAICAVRLAEFGYDVALARRSRLGQVAFLPRAMLLSWRARSRLPLREAWRHALGPIWARRHDRELAARAAEDRGLAGREGAEPPEG